MVFSDSSNGKLFCPLKHLMTSPSVEVKGKYLYLYWITLSANWAVLLRGPVRTTPHGSSVTTEGNRVFQRKPAMLGRVKLDNTLLTCDQGNFNRITARSRNWTLVTTVRDTCTTTVPLTSLEWDWCPTQLKAFIHPCVKVILNKWQFSRWRCTHPRVLGPRLSGNLEPW